jgi:site-specific recombinase XerD
MTIYLSKKSGKYRCEPRINGKRLKSKSFSRKSDALKYEREMIQAEEELIAKGNLARDYQYQELFEIWYSDAKLRKADSSLVKDFQMHRDYIAPNIGKLKVSEINTLHFNKMTTLMKKANLADSSINKVIQQYKAVFNYAYKHDLIVKNPSKAVSQIKLPELKINFLEKNDLKKLLHQSSVDHPTHSSSRWVYVFKLALFFTGARLGEVRVGCGGRI